MEPTFDITILCRVVDNYGDIGVVYRLARTLYNLGQKKLRIIVDNLNLFSLLAPGINPDLDIQVYDEWTICKWGNGCDKFGNENCISLFMKQPPQVILECFACGRPDWLENILFSPDFDRTVQIINLEYLTAESYADDFHKLMSLTRSAKIKKVNFMPGFTNKTGGLILDDDFMNEVNKKLDESFFYVVVFSYEQDFSSIVKALADTKKTLPISKELVALVAPGLSQQPFLSAWEKAGKPFKIELLPFMPQKKWDAMLADSSFLFVRGEDSLSRACLSGRPFIWHAYPQSENYQLVKVEALLEKMKPFFSNDDFLLIYSYYILYNDSTSKDDAKKTDLLIKILKRYDDISRGFFDFADMLKKNGNLASHLMTFISEIVYNG